MPHWAVLYKAVLCLGDTSVGVSVGHASLAIAYWAHRQQAVGALLPPPTDFMQTNKTMKRFLSKFDIGAPKKGKKSNDLILFLILTKCSVFLAS